MSAPASSLKWNVVANYVAQVFTMVGSIIVVPIYLTYMGTEAYGLVGFFTMMTAWFLLLDMGLTPTMTRETARFRGGAISISALHNFLHALEAIFGAVSALGAALMIVFAGWIATRWLKVQTLPLGEVEIAVVLMGLSIPLRWVSGLYRGVVAGFEQQVWLAGFTIVISGLRFFGVLVVFWLIGTTPSIFFAYQLFIAVAELAGLGYMTYRLIGSSSEPRKPFSFSSLKGNVGFSLAIAFAAMVWVAVTQTDKLLLSKWLPLAQYGMYSVAVAAANVINSAFGPFGQALLPRLTKLAAEGNEAGVSKTYSDATQAVCVLVAPPVILICFFADPLLWMWTGRQDLAAYAGPILRLYAIGNGFVALNAFAYYIQYARGDLFLHFIGNAVMSLTIIPLYFFAARASGGIGTGWAWAIVNGLYTVIWVAVVHRRVYKGRHWTWLTRDVLPVLGPVFAVGAIAALFRFTPASRVVMFGYLAVLGMLLLTVAVMASSMARAQVGWLIDVVRAGRRASL